MPYQFRKSKCHVVSQKGKMPWCQLERQNAKSVKLAVLYFTPNIFGTTPLSPTCHPERSGTPGLRASATTKQRRAVEPRPPGGAPAGGISVAERHPPTHPAIQPHPRQKNKKPPSIRTWSTRYHLILRTHEHPLRAYPLADNGGTVADYARKKSRFPRTAESDFHRRLRGTCTNRPLSARTVPLYSSLSLRLRNQYTTFSPRCQQVCGIFFKRQTDQLHAFVE